MGPCTDPRSSNSHIHVMTDPCHDCRAMLQGKGIDCLATHPGLAATPLYPKLDKSKPEAVAVNLFEKV